MPMFALKVPAWQAATESQRGAVADKLRKVLFDCTWEEDDGDGNIVVLRARVNQLPRGETATATNLPPHYWAGDEG